MSFPHQVTYGAPGNNPTLIPNFGTPVVTNGVLTLTSGGALDASVGGVAASGNVTIAGTVASGQTIIVTVANGCLPGGVVAVPYLTTVTDTLITVAAELATALSANKTLSQYGWSFSTVGTAEIVCTQRGPVGDFTTLSATTTGAETFTYVQPTGGTGLVIPLSNFSMTFNNTLTQYWYGKPVLMAYSALASAVSQGVPLS